MPAEFLEELLVIRLHEKYLDGMPGAILPNTIEPQWSYHVI
jgi:hypothetical protein